MREAVGAVKTLDVEAVEDDVARELGQLRVGGVAAAATKRNRRIVDVAVLIDRPVTRSPLTENIGKTKTKFASRSNLHEGARTLLRLHRTQINVLVRSYDPRPPLPTKAKQMPGIELVH